MMASKEYSFLSNIKMEKEGLEMIKSIKEITQNTNKSIDCGKCGGKKKVAYSSEVFPYKVAGEDKEITILNAPVYKCEECGEESINVLLYAEVEDIIDKEIFIRLNKRQEIPTEVDFSAFTQTN